MSLKFVNLHGHDGFSLYDGYGDPEEHFNACLENAGEDSMGMAITNHGTMNSIGYFAALQKKIKNKGVPFKFIYGMEAYVIPSLDEWHILKQEDDELKKEEKKKKKDKEEDGESLVFENEAESKSKYFDPIKRRNHLVLFAYNQKGLTNLYRLVSRSHREGMYRKPRIDYRMLLELNEGLIASTACIAGIPSYHSMQSANMEEAHQKYDKELLPLMQAFGKDRFYLELQFNKIPEQQLVNQHLVEYSKKTGYNLIVTADAHYPRPEDWKARELYRMLGYQMSKNQDIDKSILDKKAEELDCHLYLKNGDQLFQSYKDSPFAQICPDEQLIKEAIERTYDIAHNFCENVTPDNTTKLPKPSKVVAGKTSFQVLSDTTFAELKAKGLSNDKKYFDRLVHELKIIKKLNLADYFLLMKEQLDVLRNHMLLNDGRGSGAGSLVNYMLDVTMIDPVKEELLFERFLSSTKASADIDSDVELREEALDILKNHFGADNVIAISNYNKLQLKSIVKDISKLYGIEFFEVNAVTAVMEKEAKDKILAEINHDQKLYNFNFESALKHSPTFSAFVQKYPIIGAYAESLYREVKSIGKHAGGVIIVPDAEACLPVIKIRGLDQSPITEGVTAQHLEYFGLIKYDILGLTTLKIIRRCIENILINEGNSKPSIKDVWKFYNNNLRSENINASDEKVFKNVYHNGRFPSIFQFEQYKVQNFCMKAEPRNVKDLAVLTSLFRPGPLSGGADKKYLNYNPSELKKEHPIIQKILGETRGLIVFQEQFMQLAHELADLSLEEADVLRKILVKPSQELGEELRKKRDEYRVKFIEGCVAKGLDRERATKLWDEEIIGFVSYGFNKAHATCYAFASFRCAWLFTYHPEAWIKACLERDPELGKTINVTRSLGYNVSKVDVNNSAILEWSYANDTWLPPLTSLKGLGAIGACELVNQKPDGGFKDLKDFFFNEYGAFRWSKFNKKCVESLCRTEGLKSLDCIGEDKTFKNYRHLNDFLSENWDKFKKGKVSLDEAALIEVPDWTNTEKIQNQKEITGFYDKGLIVNKLLNTFREFNISAIDEYHDIQDEDEQDGPMNKIWAVVEGIEEKVSRNNRKYYTISVSGMGSKIYRFKANLKPNDLSTWQIGNAVVCSLDYSQEWGYSLSKSGSVLRINK
jgi:DNA polymerase-3 subunit alpha